MFGKKIKLYVYVLFSNILKEEGKVVFVKNYFDLNIILFIFYGDERGFYVSEIGRDKIILKLFNFLRFFLGFYYDKDDMWSLFNVIVIYGYWVYFVYFDDVILNDRGKDKIWNELKKEFDKLIGEVEVNYLYLELIRVFELI